MKKKLIPLIGILLLTASNQNIKAQSSRFDELANLPFSENRPTTETAKILQDELLFQRATKTYLWALPLVNRLGMKESSAKTFDARYNLKPAVETQGQLTDKDIADAYIYLLARELVLKQERLDFEKEGFKWNQIIYRTSGGVAWANPNLDVAYSEAWVVVDSNTCVLLEIPESQYYLMTIKDKDGKTFDGSKHYKLNVPANVPVTQYWSMTVYNRENHAFIREAKWMGRSSQTPGIQKNSDGSVNIYFGPTPPSSGESNWIPTDPKGQFECLHDFMVSEALYEKSWKVGDIEELIMKRRRK